MATGSSEEEAMSPREMLLHAARNNHLDVVNDLLTESRAGRIKVDVNCKGRSKWNQSWTPLHLASYFGHRRVVEALLRAGADPNSVNDAGDTPLHRAAYTGRMEVVLLLLQHHASVQISNGEGQLASQLAVEPQVKAVVEAAEKSETKRTEEELLSAARDGHLDRIRALLAPQPGQRRLPPSVNCIDMFGNSPLHCAAYRGQTEVAVLLLQHGAEAALRNLRGQTPVDMAQDRKIKQLLEITPGRRELVRSVKRCEGTLLKKSRIFGWKPAWIVLERGVMSVFASRADSAAGVDRKSFKYLDAAKVEASARDKYSFFVVFNDNTSHIFSVHPPNDRVGIVIDGVSAAEANSAVGGPNAPPPEDAEVSRQKWMTAIKDHVEFSDYYIRGGAGVEATSTDDSEDVLPMGNLAEAFATAQAHQKFLEARINESNKAVEDLLDQKFWKTLTTSTTPSSESNGATVSTRRVLSPGELSSVSVGLVSVRHHLSQLSETGRTSAAALARCLSLFEQQEEARKVELRQAQERIRILQDSLHILATQHHELEKSLAGEVGAVGGDIGDGVDGGVGPEAASSRRSSVCFSENSEEYYDIEDDEDAMTMVSYHSMDSDDDDDEQGFLDLDLDRTPMDELDFNEDGPLVRGMAAASLFNGSRGDGAAAAAADPASHCDVSASTTRSSLYQEAQETPASPHGDGTEDGAPPRRASIASLPFEPSAEQRALYPMFGREQLPRPMVPRASFSVWSILKQCIGRDLSQITMPVVFNEPLSMLQRIAENMEYSLLLDKAAASKTPLARLQFVAAFAVSAAASNADRLGKPFNPLLGETYELRRDAYCFVAEQVSHHPPVSAFHAESPTWKFRGSVSPKIRFWGKSLEVQPKGAFTVELLQHSEAYTWTNVNCCVHNIIVGKLWIEHYGCLEVQSHRGADRGGEGFRAVVNFKPVGWMSGDLHKVEGFVTDRHKRKVRALHGKWTDSLWTMDLRDSQQFVDNESLFNGVMSRSESAIAFNAQRSFEDGAVEGDVEILRISTSSGGSGGSAASSAGAETGDAAPIPRDASADSRVEFGASLSPLPDTLPLPDGHAVPDIHHLPSAFCLWKADPRPDDSETYYNFTRFAMMLNEPDPDQTARLPPTDSRLRPDIRLLENGDLEGAAAEKHRLEEKQRATRRLMKKTDSSWKCLWFYEGLNPHTGTQDWLFNTDYWKRDWTCVANIF